MGKERRAGSLAITVARRRRGNVWPRRRQVYHVAPARRLRPRL